jgi:hypothetical protein
MSNGLIEFYNRWLYDMGSKLRGRLETLKDDLRSDDEDIRKHATEEADEILDWLYLPPKPLSDAEQLQRVEEALKDGKMSAKERLAVVRRAGRSTGRAKGRPRDETSRLAIRALGLHLATGMSWREIAMKLKGCDHKRPLPARQKPRKRNPALSCDDCGEAMRVAVYRLRSFLKQLGFEEEDVPLGKDLDEESRMEILKLWGV